MSYGRSGHAKESVQEVLFRVTLFGLRVEALVKREVGTLAQLVDIFAVTQCLCCLEHSREARGSVPHNIGAPELSEACLRLAYLAVKNACQGVVTLLG
jgi:hypothetical protein